MRIISGTHKGLTLASVGKGDAAAHLRPTSDRVRESIFNLLLNGGYGNPVAGARVLDLFAGTAALGLEALSRGATHITFVDDGTKARSLIRQNIKLCQAAEKTTYFNHNATRLGQNPNPPYDLIFLDPPYGKSLGEKAITSAIAGGWLSPEALIIWEESTAVATPQSLTKLDARRYGDTWINVFEFSA